MMGSVIRPSARCAGHKASHVHLVSPHRPASAAVMTQNRYANAMSVPTVTDVLMIGMCCRPRDVKDVDADVKASVAEAHWRKSGHLSLG